MHPLNIEADFDLDIDYAQINFHGKKLQIDAQAHVIYGYVDHDETDWEFEWVQINYITDEDGIDVVLSGAEEAELIEMMNYFLAFSFLVPYLERLFFLSLTPAVSKLPRTM
jgi:hypothetical protein